MVGMLLCLVVEFLCQPLLSRWRGKRWVVPGQIGQTLAKPAPGL